MRFRSAFLLAVVAWGAVSARAQKVAQTPPMGWNTWNTFTDRIDEWLIRDTADLLVSSGMRDAGYTYLVIDDCWALRERDAGGNAMKDRHGSRTTVTWARAATGNGANTGVVKPSRTGEPGDPVVTSACIMVPGSIAERNVPPGSNR